MSENESFDTERAADTLLDIFEQYAKDIGGAFRVTQTGLEEMSSLFGTVPLEDRGYVFLNFLGMLNESDYSFDMQQFMEMEEVKEDEETTTSSSFGTDGSEQPTKGDS